MSDGPQDPQQYGQPPHGQPAYGQPAYGQPRWDRYGRPVDPQAPYGVHPVLGIPYSDKSKLLVGILQIVVPFGVGRMVAGQVGLGVAQCLVAIFTCGIGSLWSLIDGVLILVNDDIRDPQGRPLRPEM
ncbi:TM2 domain-containing protein [Nocardioides daejeonensis]|uniref:TM2 domain-containing protein n=1 Tax=Nocardioides daejeonensis TaxID=1046556 RepID=UPI000D746661|nr:TM2 domain-containing protein [Nocardioides daejeonensis]